MSKKIVSINSKIVNAEYTENNEKFILKSFSIDDNENIIYIIENELGAIYSKYEKLNQSLLLGKIKEYFPEKLI